jgi:hypothetical protein
VSRPHIASTCTNALAGFRPFRPVPAGGTGEKSWSRPRLPVLSSTPVLSQESLPPDLLGEGHGE